MTKAVDCAYFTRRMFIKSVLPAPLAGIGLALAEMGDTILVGHAIGMDGLAAIGFTTPLFLVATFFVFGLSMGGAIVYSNFMHQGKKEEALGVFSFFLRTAALIGFGITVGGLVWQENLLIALGISPEDGVVYELTKSYLFYILLGIPFEILMEVFSAYLRNDDADTFSIVVQTAAGAGNIIISAALLFWFDWGIAGCSFGFFFSNFAATVISVAYILFRSDGELSLCGKTISFREAIKPLRLGFSTATEYIFDAVFTLVVIHLLADMAGTDGVAIFNIIENLSLLFIFMYEFIGKTSQPLFSTFFTECNFAELHRVFRYGLLYSLLLGVLATIMVIVYPEILDLLFGLEDIEDVAKVYYASRIFCLGTIFMGGCLILQNYLQSEEDEWSAFLVVFMRRIGASLPLAFILEPFGFYIFWLVYPLSEVVTLLVLGFYKKRKGEMKKIPRERVYNATFTNGLEEVSTHLETMEQFAISWGADRRKCNTLRLAVEEVCGIAKEQALNKPAESILTQLSLIAQENGKFQLYLRNNGANMDSLQLNDDCPIVSMEDQEKLGLIVLRAAKTRARQFLYRNYHGFNTIMVTV